MRLDRRHAIAGGALLLALALAAFLWAQRPSPSGASTVVAGDAPPPKGAPPPTVAARPSVEPSRPDPSAVPVAAADAASIPPPPEPGELRSFDFRFSTEGTALTVLTDFRSEDPDDARVTVTNYYKRLGEAEKRSGGTWAKRDAEGLWVSFEKAIDFRVPVRFRTRIVAYGKDGNIRWHDDRHLDFFP